jgi:hypothetical protein
VNVSSGEFRWTCQSGGYFPTIYSNGVERLRINGSTGNVLINTTTDAGFKLDVNGTARVKGAGTGSAFSFKVENSAGTTNFYVADDGKIEMGNNVVFGRFYTNNSGSSFPAYSFNGNSQTGMFSLGANIFGLGTANVERLRVSNGGIGINTLAANNASSVLQVDSTTQGFLPPRMTTTQKNAIASPSAGLMVYDTTLNLMALYNGTTWTTL